MLTTKILNQLIREAGYDLNLLRPLPSRTTNDDFEFCDTPGCVLPKDHGGDHKYAKGF